ncbi:transposase (fragment) [Xanthomonas citri pv. bilvae]
MRYATYLLGAVEALVHGGRLTLIDIARAWPGATRVRAPLKACDRLLCNRTLQAERSMIERDMAHWLLRGDQPVIVIDWSDLKPDKSWCLLRAAVPIGGRTLTLADMGGCRETAGIARRGKTLLATAQANDSRRCASDPGHGRRIPHAMVSRGVGDGLGLGRASSRTHAGQTARRAR